MGKGRPVFVFFMSGQPSYTYRLNKKREIPCLKKPYLSIKTADNQFLVPKLVLTDQFGHNTGNAIHIGEAVDGKLVSKVTYVMEPLITFDDPAITYVGDIAMNLADPRRIRCFVPVGKRIVVNMQLIEMENSVRTRYRTFVIGDYWRKNPWLMPITEVPPQAQVYQFPNLRRR